MKIKNTRVAFLEESIIRSGYPHRTGEPDDIVYDFDGDLEYYSDDADMSRQFANEKRAQKLASVPSGSGHDNWLKGVIVQFDLQYPEYFSPQLQRYSWVDIISSQSKMHKITSRELTKKDFTEETLADFIDNINRQIKAYHAFPEEKELWFKRIVSNLPSGYLKWMGISTNYLQLKTIYKQRRNHKLQEWQYFCDWIEGLPMSELITGIKTK